MKILENYIAPTEHSQGDVGDIWIDKSTGDVYKCTGIAGSAKDLGYITIGADATNTKYMWEKLGGSVMKRKAYYFSGDSNGQLIGKYHPDRHGEQLTTDELIELWTLWETGEIDLYAIHDSLGNGGSKNITKCNCVYLLAANQTGSLVNVMVKVSSTQNMKLSDKSFDVTMFIPDHQSGSYG